MITIKNLQVKVAGKVKETDDISTFELLPETGASLPSFEAGAHVDMHVPGGIIRQYSLCNDPKETHRYLVGILKDPASRGGSVAIHEQVNEGDTLTISEPRNHFPLSEDAEHSLLLAGGIGVTPILCMAERLSSLGKSFEMHYCTRSKDLTAFASRIAQSSFAANVTHHYDDGAKEQLLDIPGLLSTPKPGVHLYVCGPKGFMDAVLSTAREAAWPEEQLHYEFFSADVGPSDSDSDFVVEIASTGKLIPIPKEKTIIEVLEAAVIDITMSCEPGVCGTCLTRVL